jgi:hypothetical protein
MSRTLQVLALMDTKKPSTPKPRELSTKGSTLMANMSKRQQANWDKLAGLDRPKETPEERKARLKALGYDVD